MYLCTGMSPQKITIVIATQSQKYFFTLASADLNGWFRTRIKSQHNEALKKNDKVKAIQKIESIMFTRRASASN